MFCIKVSRRRRKTVLVPQTNYLRLWHGKKNPWRYALKYFKTILPRTFLCLPCWQRLTFIATTRSSIFYRTIQTTWNSGTPHFHVSVVRHEEKCFFWSVSLQPTKRSTFPHAVLLRQERVACHCFMSFGLCNKNGTASCGYKSQPLSARQTKKSPWLYSLEVFQGIPPRIFLAVP